MKSLGRRPVWILCFIGFASILYALIFFRGICEDCIYPNKGVGKLRFNDSAMQVVKLLGEPDNSSWDYNSIEYLYVERGILIRFGPSKNMHEGSVENPDSAGARVVSFELLSELPARFTDISRADEFQAFHGQYNEQVGLGSTPEDFDLEMGEAPFILDGDQSDENNRFNCLRRGFEIETSFDKVSKITLRRVYSDGCEKLFS